MSLLSSLSTAFTAFTATNLDDIVILLLFFSQGSALFRHRHIVTGQYLGFAALVLASLPGFFGGLLLPLAWTGMLGLVPIAIGFNRLLNRDQEEEAETDLKAIPEPIGGFLSPQTYGVAAITFANGGDNVGIYVPLFASCTWESLAVMLSVFFCLVGVWCYTAYRLASVPAIAKTLTRYGNQFVPFVLIGLGALILIESHTLEDRGLLLLTLVACCGLVMTLSRNLMQSAEK